MVWFPASDCWYSFVMWTLINGDCFWAHPHPAAFSPHSTHCSESSVLGISVTCLCSCWDKLEMPERKCSWGRPPPWWKGTSGQICQLLAPLLVILSHILLWLLEVPSKDGATGAHSVNGLTTHLYWVTPPHFPSSLLGFPETTCQMNLFPLGSWLRVCV